MKPIPAGRRDGRLFDDAAAVLAWILRWIDRRRRSPIRVNIAATDNRDRVLALFMLLRTVSSHGKAVLAASRRGVAEASQANLRAMLELWADFNYIRADKSGEAYRLMAVAGAFALMRRQPDAAVEAAMQARFPTEFAAVKARLEKRAFAHWSGKGRKAMVETYCGPAYGPLYEVLSWDVHPVLPGLLDVAVVDEATGEFRLQHRQPQGQVSEEVCLTAAHIVRAMWNDLAADYGGQ